MDIKIEKKPWYIRYKFYIAGGIAFVAFLVYVIILSAGRASSASSRKTYR